jgi:hypothetical protein
VSPFKKFLDSKGMTTVNCSDFEQLQVNDIQNM